MNKNLLLAGVSAVALAFAAGVAFANADNNTSDNGSVTNVNQGVTDEDFDGGSAVFSSQSGDNRSNNNSLNGGQIGNDNVTAEFNLDVDNHSTDHSKNYKNEAEFKSNSSVTSSVLSATIAASDVNFNPKSDTTYDGNLVDVDSFQGANGIAGVNQNVGMNSNNQQSVTVASGAISINSVGAR